MLLRRKSTSLLVLLCFLIRVNSSAPSWASHIVLIRNEDVRFLESLFLPRGGSSILSNETAVVANKTIFVSNHTRPQNISFSVFQKGDGHEEDPDGIIGRYLRMHKGNRRKAKRSLEETLQWRADNEIDTMLSRPHEKFDFYKEFQPHTFVGRDRSGHVILVQRPGYTRLDMLPLIDPDDLLMHYIFVMEYCWNMIEPRPDQTMTSILDLQNVSLQKSRELIGFVKRYANAMETHYPERSHMTLIINAPRWFGTIYRLISPFLRESTKERTNIFSKGKKQEKALREIFGDEPVPRELLEGRPFHDWKAFSMEKEMRNFVSTSCGSGLIDVFLSLRSNMFSCGKKCLDRLEYAGMEMLPIPDDLTKQ